MKVSADWQFKAIQIDSLNRFESIQHDQILTRLPDQNPLSETRNSPAEEEVDPEDEALLPSQMEGKRRTRLP